MKKVLIITGLLLIIGYILFVIFWTKDKPMEGVCAGVEFVFEGKSQKNPTIIDELEKIINGNNLNPEGKAFKDINTYEIEKVVLGYEVVRNAKVYITGNKQICIAVEEREPIIRIMSNTGESYYIDRDGERIPVSKHFTAYLPLATGTIKEAFAKEELYKFALFLQKDNFWNAQIEQIVVMPNEEVKLIPRVGDQEIIMGSLSDHKEKLSKLMTFYKKGQSKTGWNKYKELNLKFDKQVVGTKR